MPSTNATTVVIAAVIVVVASTVVPATAAAGAVEADTVPVADLGGPSAGGGGTGAPSPAPPPASRPADATDAASAGPSPAADGANTGHEPWFFFLSGVNAANGNLYRAEEDLAVDALGGDLRLVRSYSSHASAEHGPFGFGWTHNYDVRVDERPDGTVALRDADGSVHEFAPTATGYEAPAGVHTRLSANGSGWTLRRTDGTTSRFDATGRLRGMRDANGNRVRLTYAGGRLAAIADDSGRQLALAYDAAGRITALSGPLGRTVEYAYETGDLVAVTDPANRTTEYAYYANHKLRRAVEPSGRVRSVAYEPETDRVACVGAGGSTTGCSDAGYEIDYDPTNRTTTYRSLLTGDETTVLLDAAGSPLRVRTPTETVLFEWDADRNRVRTTNRTGTYRFAYDGYGHRTRRVGVDGATRTWTWVTDDDADGYRSRLVAETDERGYTTTYDYDAAGNRVRETNPAGDVRRFRYDATGSLVSETDFGGHETRYVRDASGAPTAVIGPTGGVTNLTYDAAGRVTSLTDQLNNTFRYGYDVDDNVVRRVDPTGGVTTADYDAVGTLQRVERPDGRIRTPGAAPRPEFPADLSVDEYGNVTTLEAGGYAVTRRVDAAGRPVERTVDYGRLRGDDGNDEGFLQRTIDYGYDAAGNLQSVAYPDGTRNMEYDAAGRLTRVTGPDGTWARYGYDAAGRRVAANYSNGVDTRYAYDAAGRPTRVVVRGPDNATLMNGTYAYDAAGNLLSATDADGNRTRYAYDALQRLVAVAYPDGTNVTYGYDRAGNRISRRVDGASTTATAYTYDADGRLVRAGGTTYDYDVDGNLVRAVGANAAVTTYAYDGTGRLANVTRPDGESITYDYLPSGERLARSGPNGTTYFLYDGFELAAEYADDGSVAARYLQGPGFDDPVARVTGDGTAFYHVDPARNVRLVTNATGAVTTRYSYAPFGTVRSATGATDDPYRFASRRYDAATGLYYNRMRYYDPAVGRFTRADPAGLSAGINWYAYAGNNPTRYTDPMGLDRWEGTGVFAGGNLFVVGFSSFTGTFTNLDTGQTCSGTMYCLEIGPGLGGSGGAAVTHFDGPSCGKGLAGLTVDFAICAAAGAGVGASSCGFVGQDGGQAGAGAGQVGIDASAAIVACKVVDPSCSCNDDCEDCDPDDPPPGNDHPDDNHDVTALSYAERYPSAGGAFPDFAYDAGAVAVLGRGFSAELTDFLTERNVTSETVAPTATTAELSRYDALVVPSGGLHGLQSYGAFETRLERFVADGGTLVVLSQPRGSHYAPVPGGLGGYGWLEDQSCQLGSVGVTTFCPALASLDGGVADLNVDGYFLEYPANATVLLSRTKNGEPAMLTYDYGGGRVLATAAYPDWAFGHHASHAEGRALLGDVVTWARTPNEVSTYGPGESLVRRDDVTSYVDVVADDVTVELVGPEGTRYPTNVSESLAPLANRSVVGGATLPADAPLGLWDVEYALANDTYGVVQRGRLGGVGVVTFDPSADGWSYRGGNLSLSVNSDTERYVDGSNATFTLTVRNRGATAETATVHWSFPHNYWRTGDPVYGAGTTSPASRASRLNRTVTVPADGVERFSYTVPVYSYDRLWAELTRGNGTDGEYLGRSSRGFRTFEPAVNATVTTNVSSATWGDDVAVTASFAAADAVAVDRSIRVVGPTGAAVVTNRTSVVLAGGPNATRTETLVARLPTPATGGPYTAIVEARDGTETVGYDTATFAVPATSLSVRPDLPSPPTDASTVDFGIEHGGGLATNATLNVSLVDAGGATVWSTGARRSLAPNESTTVTVAPAFDPRAVGDYRLTYRLDWAGAARPIRRARTLPNGATAATTFDRRTYAEGETVTASVDVTNLGVFERDLPVAVALPAANVTTTRTVTLSPGGTTTLPFAATLPGDVAPGAHDVTVTLGAGTAAERTRADTIVVPESSVSVAVTPGPYAAGGSVPVTVANDGGVTTTVDCTIGLYGPSGRRFDAVAAAPSVAPGGTATPSLAVPAAAATGPYLVSGSCTDTRTGERRRVGRSVDVDGLTATVASTTDATRYAPGDDVAVRTTVDNTGTRAVDGTVTLRVLDAAAGATGGTNGTNVTGTSGVATGGLATAATGALATATDDDAAPAPTTDDRQTGTGPPAPVNESRWATAIRADDGDGGVSTAGVSTATVRVDPATLAAARSVGPLTVTNATVWRNETVVLEDNLTVASGGSLTLSNATVVVNASTDGEFGIEVLSGGAIETAANATVIARDTDAAYAFRVRAGADATLRDTTVRDVGYYDSGRDDVEALWIEPNGTVIENLTVTGGDEGLTLAGAADSRLTNVSTHGLTVREADNVTLTGFTWSRDERATVEFDRANDSRLVDNAFTAPSYDDVTVDLYRSSDALVRNNTFDDALVAEGGYYNGVELWANRNRILHNTFEGGSVVVIDGNETVIANNTFPGRYGGDVSVDGYRNVVRDNRLSRGSSGGRIRVTGGLHPRNNTVVRNVAGELDVESDGNLLRDNRADLARVDGDDNRLVNETYSGPSSGLVVAGTDVVVRDANLSGNERYGLLLDRATNATVVNATVRDNARMAGEYTDFFVWTTNFGTSRRATPETFDHTIRNVTVSGGPLVYLTNRTGVTAPTDAGAVWVAGGDGVTVADVNVSTVALAYTANATVRNATVGGGYYGVLLYGTNDSRVEAVRSRGARYGVYLEGAAGNEVIDANVSSDVRYATGVYLRDAPGSVIRGTVATGSQNGVFAYRSDGVTVVGSDVSVGRLREGIEASDSDDVVIADNRLSNELKIERSARATVANNTIVGAETAITVDGTTATNTTVRNNTIRRPTGQAVRVDDAVDTRLVDTVIDVDGGGGSMLANAIYVTTAERTRIVGGRIDGARVGIHVDRDDVGTVVRDTLIRNVTGDGVRVTGAASTYDPTRTRDTRLVDVVVDDASTGIRLQGAGNVTLANATVTGADRGLAVAPDDPDGFALAAYRHTVTDTTVDGRPVVYWRNRTDATVPAGVGPVWVVDSTNVTVASGTAATLVGTADATVEDLVLDGAVRGVDVRRSNRTVVRNVTVRNASAGVYARDTANATIRNVTVADSDYGVHLWAAVDGRVIDVDAAGNGDGVHVTSSTRTVVAGVAAVGNGDGVEVNGTYTDGRSVGVEVRDSRLADNAIGLRLVGAIDGVVANNTVVDNTGWGLLLTGDSYYTNYNTSADGNLLYNNYVDNGGNGAEDVRDGSVGNRWNVTQRPGDNVVGGAFLGGNYWASYAGVDGDGDGIGDTALPYNNSDRYGSEIDVGGDRLPLVPERTTGPVVYETTVPVTVAGGTTRRLNTTVPASALGGVTGKLKLETELRSSLNQTVALQDPAFYVVDGDTPVTIATDRPTYAPGATIAVSGTVGNEGSGERTYALSVTADGVTVHDESLTVPAGGTATYGFETTADAPVTLRATAGGTTVTERVAVVAPSVNATLSAPAVVDRGPFAATLRVENDGTVPVAVNATVAGTRTVLAIPPGATRTATGTTSLSANGSVTATLSGDVGATLSRPVVVGERATVAVSPPAVARPGPVELPYVVTGEGSLDARVDLTVTVDGRSIDRSVAVPAGGRVAGRVVANLTPGTYPVTATSSFGTTTATVRVARPDRVALNATVGAVANGTTPVTVAVANVGAADANATLRAVAAGVGPAGDATATAGREVSVPAGANRTVTFDLRVPAGTPPGDYPVRVAAVADGAPLATTNATLNVTAPSFALVAAPSAPAYDAGARAVLNFSVANRGSEPGATTLNVTVPGVWEVTRTVRVGAGDRVNLTVPFVVPDDLATGTYPVRYAVGDDAGETTLAVRGAEVAVDGDLDARLYDAGDTATLTVTVTNRRSVPVPVFTRVQYNGYDVRRSAVLNGSEVRTTTFDVPITFPAGGDRKVFYGVYHRSGRSLHIDGAYPHERGGNLSITTDRDAYAVGDTVTVDVDPAEPGPVALSAPNFSWQGSLSGARTFRFVAPPTRTGTYYVHGSLGNESTSYPFDVDGYHARVLRAALNRSSYAGGDDVRLDLTVDPSRNVTADVSATVLDADGDAVATATTRTDLRRGGTDVALTAGLPTAATGVHTVTYGVDAIPEAGPTLSVLEGSQYVVVAPNPGARPTAAFDVDPVDPGVGEDVRFDAGASTAATGGIERYEWDLDDDGRFEARGRAVEGSFDSPGAHDVRLRVTDGSGRTNVTVRTVSVRRLVGLTLTVDRSTLTANGTVRFDLRRTDTDAPVDGTLLIDGARVRTGADGVAVYRFRTPGDVLVTATARRTANDSFGLATASVTVRPHPFPDGVPGVSNRRANDPDRDGRFEDVDGDGDFDFIDVINFLFADEAAVNADALQREALDFTRDGRVDLLDVIDLLFRL